MAKRSVTFTYDRSIVVSPAMESLSTFAANKKLVLKIALRILGPGLGADIGAAIAIELDKIPLRPSPRPPGKYRRTHLA